MKPSKALGCIRILAERCEVDHRSMFRLLVENQVSIEEDFSSVRFQIASRKRESVGGVSERFALLTEDQATDYTLPCRGRVRKRNGDVPPFRKSTI